ncbi:MAG: glycoside hydrolase family 28 protein [Verrucomicrobiota bacterium JB022]|nr:glycoside hydrolase family 28 protein [Verrucomicrobiota bacterium JB022]
MLASRLLRILPLLLALPLFARDYDVKDFGAIADGSELTTEHIQRAIDVCARDGGGRVVVSPGTYLVGSLFLKSRVEFHVQEGAEIQGSIDPEDYPTVWTRVAGIEMDWPAALINARGQHHVTLSGEGTINGRGNEHFWPWYWEMNQKYSDKGLRWVVDYDVGRPFLIQIYNCEDVAIRDLHLKLSAFWTCHIVYSDRVHVDGLTIRNNIDGVPEKEGFGPSTDGVNMDSSRNVIVENCDIDCNDDNITLKSGRDSDGLAVNLPTENIIIRNNIARRGMGMFTIGSETSGSVRNVEVYGNKAIGTTFGLRFKSAKNRGGIVEAINIHDNEMENVRRPIRFELNWFPAYSYGEVLDNPEDHPDHWQKLAQPVPEEEGLPHFRNISIRNLKATNNPKTAIEIFGLEGARVQNVYFENLYIEAAEEPGTISHAENLIFDNVVLKTPKGDRLTEEEGTTANVLWRN